MKIPITGVSEYIVNMLSSLNETKKRTAKR